MKQRILVETVVMADLEGGLCYPRTEEARAKQLESLASNFNEFVKDHRSMDWISLSVERKYEEQCSHCGYSWEVDDEGVPLCCEEAVEEQQ